MKNDNSNKRQKECFKSNEIAHVWANQSAPRGRVSGGNESFDGGKFYSYSTVIANIISHKGKTAFVLDMSGFSNSTSKHQGGVRAAIPATAQKFFVRCGSREQSLEFTPQSLRDHYLSKFTNKGENHKLAFVNAQKLVSRVESLNRAIEVCTFFKLPAAQLHAKRVKVQPEMNAACTMLDARRAKLAASQAKREATQLANRTARAIATATAVLSDEVKIQDVYFDSSLLPDQLRAQYEAAREKFEAEKIQLWQAGENVRLDYDLPACLRAEDSEMVTSKGARVPIQDAEKAFRFVIARRAAGWHRNGENFKIGGYELDAVNESGVVAGCHRVAWPEIERFAKAQAWV